MPIEIKELQIRVRVPDTTEQAATGSSSGVFVDNTGTLWRPADTTPDELVLGTDANQAATSGHAKWIEVESTTFDGGAAAAPQDTGTSNLELTVKVLDAGIAPFGDGSVRSIPPATDAAGAQDTSGSWGVFWKGDRFDPPAPETPAVSDISITKQSEIETPFYLTLEGVDGDVGAPVTERASNLTYSGESGGMNESSSGGFDQNGRLLVGHDDSVWAHVGMDGASWGLDRIDQSASGSGGGTGKVSVHDISIRKQTDGADNVELTVKVLGGGGPLSGVEYALTVTDTQTGNITERESGLVYSGESGGMNESGPGVEDYTNSDDGARKATFKEFTVTKKTDTASVGIGDPGELTTDVAGAGYEMPDVLVTSWQTSASEAGSDPIGPFFAYDAGFRGGVDVAAASQGSGYAGQIDIASYNWSVETSAAESMETMKKAWKDASGTPEGGEHHSADAGYDYDAPGRLLVTTDAAGGSWTEHGTILTGNPPDAGGSIGPFMGVYVGSGGNQQVGGGDLNDWQSNYGTGGWAAASGGGGDDILIGGITGFDTPPAPATYYVDFLVVTDGDSFAGHGHDVLIGGYGDDVPVGSRIGDTAVHEVGHWMGAPSPLLGLTGFDLV